jgi:hypothetical protein
MIKQALEHQSIQTTETCLDIFCTEELDLVLEGIIDFLINLGLFP